LSGAVYEELGDGLVRVEKRGLVGIFRGDGRYIEGDLTYADQHMLNWVGGPALPDRSAGRRGQPPPPERVTD
jgi:hypothetical protein